MHNSRSLTNQERNILEKLLEKRFPGSEEIYDQIRHASAASTGDSDNYGSIFLHTSSRSKANTVLNVPVEGIVRDTDGGEIVLLLHLRNGFVNELEILKSDGTEMIGTINPDEIEVTARNS
jgi:hypothetical protein